MNALCWHGKHDVRIDQVPDAKIEDPGDILLRVSATAICGSDLNLLDGYVPAMKSGDILGPEFWAAWSRPDRRSPGTRSATAPLWPPQAK
jgi:threonine dehydrogenase-like Zn-dependent dehydrogenase